jgi:hypothetical protein
MRGNLSNSLSLLLSPSFVLALVLAPDLDPAEKNHRTDSGHMMSGWLEVGGTGRINDKLPTHDSSLAHFDGWLRLDGI